MAEKDFEFYVGGIEDAILQTLEAILKPLGVKHFDTYSGELDSDNLKRALGALAPNFPLVLVSYTDGKDTSDPKVAPVGDKPLYFRHDCSFSVICVSADARGEKARRRSKIGVYAMLAETRTALGGIRFKAQFENEQQEIEEVILTHSPLIPSGIEYIARIPNVTAYAAFFDTYFRYATPDRSEQGTAVSTIDLSVEAVTGIENNTTDVLENDEEIKRLDSANLPGVTKEKKINV